MDQEGTVVLENNTPHTGNGIQRAAGQTQSTKRRTLKKAAAIGTISALTTALALAMPLSASADTATTAYAQGQLLSGTIGGTNLDGVVALKAATAKNDGTQPTQTSKDPLSATALNAVTVSAPNGINANLGDIADVGAVSQYAQAAKDGTSMAAVGAIGNNGAINVGPTSGGPVGSGNVTLDLDALLGNGFAKTLTDVTLQAQGIAAQANASGSTASGDYTLNGLTLNFTSPAIANLGSKVDAALAPAQSKINALNGSSGDLADSVNGVVNKINPILNLAGANASVTANVNLNLDKLVQPLLDGTYGNGAVTFDLSTGKVTVDLAKLEGGDLNNEPAGTEVLSDAVVNKILDSITGTVSTLADQILDKVKAGIADANVNVEAKVDASTAQAPVLGKVCTKSDSGSSSDSSDSGGLLGGVLGGVTKGLTGTVGGLLCKTTSKALPNLNTSLDVKVAGTVGKLTSDDPAAATATANLKLLGIPAKVNLNAVVGGIGDTLTNNLLDGSSAVSDVTSGVTKKLVEPAVDGLLSDNGLSVDNGLTDVLSVTLNNQDKSNANGGTLFTENALTVSALPSAGGSLATVKVASATVGPNVETVVDPGNPSDPGNPTSPGSPSNPGNPNGAGTPNSPISPTAFGNLAYTGVGIGMLVAVILALLAAGAYLVREGYRRNGRRQIS
jgi:hypothetical protein